MSYVRGQDLNSQMAHQKSLKFNQIILCENQIKWFVADLKLIWIYEISSYSIDKILKVPDSNDDSFEI